MRLNVEAVSPDLVATQAATTPADILWLHLFYQDRALRLSLHKVLTSRF